MAQIDVYIDLRPDTRKLIPYLLDIQSDPVPVMVLARLAVDHSAQGKKLGSALFKDAVLRTLSVVENAGLLVHALHDRAKAFHWHHGFEESPADPMTLMLRISRSLNQQRG